MIKNVCFVKTKDLGEQILDCGWFYGRDIDFDVRCSAAKYLYNIWL